MMPKKTFARSWIRQNYLDHFIFKELFKRSVGERDLNSLVFTEYFFRTHSFLAVEGERLNVNQFCLAKMQFQYYFRQCCNPFLKNVIFIVYVSWKMMPENCWCVRHKAFWNILKQLKKMLMMMSQFLGLLKKSSPSYAEIFREFMMIGNTMELWWFESNWKEVFIFPISRIAAAAHNNSSNGTNFLIKTWCFCWLLHFNLAWYFT